MTFGHRSERHRGSPPSTGRRPMAGAGTATAWLALAALALAGATSGCASEAEASLARGDRLMARGEVDAAVAEYRLARRQRGDAPEVLARLAHAYAVRGDVGTSQQLYEELVARDSTWRFQAANDLTEAAREALEEAGRDRMARALRPLVPMGLELLPRDLREELAGYHADRQEWESALPLYLSLMEGDRTPGPGVYYRAARSYQELGGCREALPFFERYLDARSGEAGDDGGALWHYGSCLYRVAQEDWRTGRREEALVRLDRLVDIGTPQTVMDRAHFLRGELLARAGRRQEALEAFREVLRLHPARSSPLARSAEERVREIRYGVP